MRTSTAHLEKALEEYNAKVNSLEPGEDTPELLDAYINRGRVLSMLDSVTSALGDFDEADRIISEFIDSGKKVDPGCCVRTYVSRGELESDDPEKMAADYRRAAAYLNSFVPGCKFYETKSAVMMCVDCSGDLIDSGFPDDAVPFIKKGMEIIGGRNDRFSRNAEVELTNMSGQISLDKKEFQRSLDLFSRSAVIAAGLYTEGKLDDGADYAYALISKGDAEEALGMGDGFFADREAALALMEEMLLAGTLDDAGFVSSLHGELGKAYMKKGEIAKAEKHLLRQMSYELTGSDEYIRSNRP